MLYAVAGQQVVHEVRVINQRRFFRALLAGAIAVVPVLAGSAVAQQPPPAKPASAARQSDPFAVTTVKRVPISKSVFGDAGIIVNARDDGYIDVAAAGPSKSVLLQLRTQAARAWADSTLRVMKARVRKADPPRSYRSEVTEYGTGTTMALTRGVDAGVSQYALAFAEKQSSFTVPIEPEEADVFVAIIRKAIAQSEKMLERPDTTVKSDSAARADSAAAAPKKKKKPAAKRVAPPPATDSASKAPAAKPPAAKPPAKP
jgi:hypothetical protein